MKTAGAVSLALFLGSMTSLAQSSGRNATQPTVLQRQSATTGCPVDMHAQQWQVGPETLRKASPGTNQQPGQAQDFRLTLKNPTFAEIVGIRITVHGLNSEGRLSPAQAAQDQSAIAKSIDLKVKVDPKSQTSTDLLLPGFTSVSVIDVDMVHYAGGSTWRSTADRRCQVAPDGVMLISRR